MEENIENDVQNDNLDKSVTVFNYVITTNGILQPEFELSQCSRQELDKPDSLLSQKINFNDEDIEIEQQNDENENGVPHLIARDGEEENVEKTIEVGELQLQQDEDNTVPNVEEKLSRKRKRNVDSWKVNKLKVLKQSGKEYIDKKNKTRSEKVFRYKSCEKCLFKCSTNIKENMAQRINKEFWTLSDSEKNNFYDKTTKQNLKKRVRRENRHSEKPRTFSFSYFFLINDTEIRVCRAFYLSVLSISSRRIQYFHKNKKAGVTSTPTRDMRGKKTKEKIPQDARNLVRQHINQFPRVPAHYCRKNTKKEYFEFGLNLRKMYELYIMYCHENEAEPVKFWLYDKIFNEEFNIEFFIPKKDQCDLCCKFSNQEKQYGTVSDELKAKYNRHKDEKEAARKEKNDDKQNNNIEQLVVAFDLQRVINLPQTNVGKSYCCMLYLVIKHIY